MTASDFLERVEHLLADGLVVCVEAATWCDHLSEEKI
jgi:hypothetical protein